MDWKFQGTIRVVTIEKKFQMIYEAGVGQNVKIKHESLGWWVIFDNHVSFYVGHDRPPIENDELLQLTLSTIPGH